MDKAEKKRLRSKYRREQNEAALKALPIPLEELRSMFRQLEDDLPEKGCAGTRQITESWLRRGRHNVERVFAWLDNVGGFCDCEVLANAEQHVDDAARFLRLGRSR